MAVERRNRQQGRRIQERAPRSYESAGRRRAPTMSVRRGRREEEPRPGERRRLWQMTISAVILLLVVACKLTMPDVMEQYRLQILSLLGEDTDFVAAFSSVGRVVSPNGGVREALNDAYTAVFGAQEVESADPDKEDTDKAEETAVEDENETTAEQTSDAAAPIVYTDDNLPENVCLTQQVLGFSFADPVTGTITDGFGYRSHPIQGDVQFHYGLDVAADSGTVIHAFAAGTVTAVGESSELGKYVTVVHPGDYTTLYAHCSRITASSGQQVSLGDPIAEVGETGLTTGPHLHFELHQNNLYLNPVYYVAH